MIPAWWVDHAEASPGRILLLRDEVADRASGIILPPHYKKHTLKAFATVLSVGPGAEILDERGELAVVPGERVILAPSAGRMVVFGYAADREIILWSVPPIAIQAKLVSGEPVWAHVPPGDARAWAASRDHAEDVNAFDEGDPRALR